MDKRCKFKRNCNKLLAIAIGLFMSFGSFPMTGVIFENVWADSSVNAANVDADEHRRSEILTELERLCEDNAETLKTTPMDFSEVPSANDSKQMKGLYHNYLYYKTEVARYRVMHAETAGELERCRQKGIDEINGVINYEKIHDFRSVFDFFTDFMETAENDAMKLKAEYDNTKYVAIKERERFDSGMGHLIGGVEILI